MPLEPIFKTRSVKMSKDIEICLQRAKINAMRLDEIDTPTFKPIDPESAADIGRVVLERFNKEDPPHTELPAA